MCAAAQNTGTSLLETFDAKQIRAHVDLIRAAAVTQKQQLQVPTNPEDACKVGRSGTGGWQLARSMRCDCPAVPCQETNHLGGYCDDGQ